MNFPEKTFDSYAAFAETFALDAEQTADEVRKHLNKLKAAALEEIYSRFVWPEPAKTKKPRVEAIVSLWEAWKDTPPQSAIAAALVPIEGEVGIALRTAKLEAENALLVVKQTKFENITGVDHYETLSGKLKDLGALAKVPDGIRKETLKPLSDTLSRIQKSVKKWRDQFDLEIDLKTAVLKTWAKDHIRSKENLLEKANDRIDYLGAAKKSLERLVNLAEAAGSYSSAQLCEEAIESFHRTQNLGPMIRETLAGQTYAEEVAKYGDQIFDILLAVYKLQSQILTVESLAQVAPIASQKNAGIEQMKSLVSHAAALIGSKISEEEAIVKQHKPKTQLGLRKVLAVDFVPVNTNPNRFDLDAEMMEDPEIRKAVQKYVLAKLKADGLKTGDKLDGYSRGDVFGDSVRISWELV